MSKPKKQPVQFSAVEQVRYCKHKNCVNLAAPNRKECLYCKCKRYRERNAVSTAFMQLRANAKRRGIPFILSFSYFRKLVLSTDYMKMRGRGKEYLTIDRKIPRLGYSDGNLQILTNADNARKRWREPDPRFEDLKTKETAGTPF